MSSVYSQAQLYDECTSFQSENSFDLTLSAGGGQGWAGATTCAARSPWTYSNVWYSRRLPEGSTGSSAVSSAALTAVSSAAPSSIGPSTCTDAAVVLMNNGRAAINA